jgi:hypothetical protein
MEKFTASPMESLSFGSPYIHIYIFEFAAIAMNHTHQHTFHPKINVNIFFDPQKRETLLLCAEHLFTRKSE